MSVDRATTHPPPPAQAMNRHVERLEVRREEPAPTAFPPDQVASFGSDVPLGRAGEPHEVATCFLFLACADSSYMTGQVLHPNGGEIVNA